MYGENDFEQVEHERFLDSLEAEIDREHAEHVWAEHLAADSKWVTELEVTTKAGETWIFEASNSHPWDGQIISFLKAQGVDNFWDWMDDYEPVESWEDVENDD